jgi:hypothetical protein
VHTLCVGPKQRASCDDGGGPSKLLYTKLLYTGVDGTHGTDGPVGDDGPDGDDGRRNGSSACGCAWRADNG